MPPPSPEPAQPLTASHIATWIHQATVKRLELQLRATNPYHSARAQTFLEMAELCKDAIEEVRVVSAELCEVSEAARIRAADLIAESARLLTEHTRLQESQLLEIFKGNQGQQAPSE